MSQHNTNNRSEANLQGDNDGSSSSMSIDPQPSAAATTSTTSTSSSTSTSTPTPTSTDTRTPAPRSSPGIPPSRVVSTPLWPTASDRSQTSLSVHPELHPRSPSSSSSSSSLQRQHLPLPEREDSSQLGLRPITFGSLKKASMSTSSGTSAEGSNSGSFGSGQGDRKSKMTNLPSYLRHTTFSQHFQPEGTGLHDQVSYNASGSWSSSLPERDHSKRRRLLADNSNRRRHHIHFHLESDSSSSSSSGGGNSGSSSDGSDSGHSSYEYGGESSTRKTIKKSTDTRPLRYQLPSRWSTIDKTDKTELLEDDLMVHYTGMYIGIGVCNAGVDLNRLPGWEPHSWGYHGDDGNSFGGCGNGRPFGPVFTTGDTVGCGVNFRDMSLFYTKNGVYLGTAFRDLKGPLYPTVGMRTVGEIIEANFGQQEFLFDIDEYVKDEKVEAWQALEDTLQKATVQQNQVGVMSQSLRELVLSYMIHHGYSETALQFSRDLAPPSSSTCHVPQQIRIAILAGEIDQSMELLEDQYPGILDQNEDMLLQLRCRKFVEMVTSSSSHLKALDDQGRSYDMDTADKTGHHSPSKTAKSITSGNHHPEPMDIDQEVVQQSESAKKKGKMVEKTGSMEHHRQHHHGVSEEGMEGLGQLRDAIKYGQYLQEQYKDSKRSSVQDMLIDAFSVLAHSDPDAMMENGTQAASSTAASEAAASGISKPVSRDTVANTVNTAILGNVSHKGVLF
ncbi:Ran-binding protein 10 [Podila humilis]|nr:Ran-binding protein 10 [Podila humilis]